MVPQEPPANLKRLLLLLVGKYFPSTGGGTIMYKSTPSSDGNETAVNADGGVPDRPVRREIVLRNLDGVNDCISFLSERQHYFNMLPDVRLGIDNTHIWLIGPAIYQYPIVHLQERIFTVILGNE